MSIAGLTEDFQTKSSIHDAYMLSVYIIILAGVEGTKKDKSICKPLSGSRNICMNENRSYQEISYCLNYSVHYCNKKTNLVHKILCVTLDQFR